jgi:hypothetical protein
MKETTKKFIHIHTALNPISKPSCADKTLVSGALLKGIVSRD